MIIMMLLQVLRAKGIETFHANIYAILIFRLLKAFRALIFVDVVALKGFRKVVRITNVNALNFHIAIFLYLNFF